MASTQTIPAINDGYLWCSCDQRFDEGSYPDACPRCGRDMAGLVAEAERNNEVVAWVERHPIDSLLPKLGESNADYWARMVAAWEAHRG